MAETLNELRAADLALAPGKAAFSATVKAGEIVGLAGLDGHGQERFLEILAGLVAPGDGEVIVTAGASETRIAGFRHAVRNDIAYLPRDRRATGIFPALSILDNFSIATVWRDVRGGLISNASRRARYAKFHEQLSIVAPNGNAPITSLSGGNQQKVLLARWLVTQPRLLILDEPTRGIDVAAKEELIRAVAALAREGMAVLFISAEIAELLRESDRIVVLRERSKVGELPGDCDEHAVYALIAESG
jgi:ribose transport system ATP-binding protein